MNAEPELAENTNAAFETVCKSLGVTTLGHYAAELVATKIAELSKDGVHDSDELSRRVLKDGARELVGISCGAVSGQLMVSDQAARSIG
jgi:hypothetical protein